MKKIKRLSLVIALILVANIKVFAESGFEAALSVPLGASFGIFTGESDFTVSAFSSVAPNLSSGCHPHRCHSRNCAMKYNSRFSSPSRGSRDALQALARVFRQPPSNPAEGPPAAQPRTAPHPGAGQ